MAYYLKLLLNMALPLVQRLHLPSHRRLLCAAAIELTSAVDPNAIISFGREISYLIIQLYTINSSNLYCTLIRGTDSLA